MTEFEQQVAEALEPEFGRLLEPVVTAATKLGAARDVAAIERYKSEMGDACDALADMLQQRVAAAIDAAIQSPPTLASLAEIQRRTAAALAALRGSELAS